MTQVRKRRPATPRQAVGCAGPIDELLDAGFFKGLSDPTRLVLLGCLAKCARACSVTEIAECCAADFSVVSRHLALLARCGIVQSSKRGRVVSYAVRYSALIGRFKALADALRCCRSCPPEGRDCCGRG